MSVTQKVQQSAPEVDTSTPVILGSIDSHVGPRLAEDLRPYCPAAHLDAFDEFAQRGQLDFTAMMKASLSMLTDEAARADTEKMMGMIERNSGPGHYDPEARLHDMDRDGIAAEVIFHASQNGQPIPFLGAMGGGEITWDPATSSPSEREMVAVGQHIYNAWLADFCARAPQRLIGLASVPLWDLEAAMKEARWAKEAGLHAINFPAPRMGIPEYDDPVLEPFWSLVEELSMPLVTHAGAAFFRPVLGPQMVNMMELEGGGWPSRRGLARVIFGGVFNRHPGVTMIFAEQAGDWWSFVSREMDSSWKTHRAQIKEQVPRPPSEFLQSNVYIGASFTAPFEARAAVEGGYATRLMWGRDYPHIEGTFQNLPTDQPNMTHLSLRHAFADLPLDCVELMVGGNMARAFNLNHEELSSIATTIGAPTLKDLTQPLDRVPELGGTLAFRTIGAWG